MLIDSPPGKANRSVFRHSDGAFDQSREERQNRGKTNTSKPAVLVLGDSPRIVVTIARSLHKHGIPVDVANSTHSRPYSRAIRLFLHLPAPHGSASDFVACVRTLATRHGHDMLIPANDETLAAVTENYDDLKEFVKPMCPPPRVTRLVLDKTSTLEIARQCGISVPRTIVISSPAQLPELAHSFPFPWILKPAAKQQIPAKKTYRLRNADEITKYFALSAKFTPPLLLQEFCPGDGVGIEVLLHGGECRAVFQHRRIKEFPHDGGVAAVAVAESPDPALVQSSLSLLKAIGWEGVAMVEYKVNRANGKAVLMEVNGRYWGSLSLAIQAGVDFPLFQWKLEHGELLSDIGTYSVGQRWRWTGGIAKRLHGLLVASTRSAEARKELLSDLWQIPQDFGLSTHDALFTITDPLPAVLDALAASKELLGLA